MKKKSQSDISIEVRTCDYYFSGETIDGYWNGKTTVEKERREKVARCDLTEAGGLKKFSFSS